MKIFIQSPSDTGTLQNRFKQRVEVIECVDGRFTAFNGFNSRVHLTKAETVEAAIQAFGLTPYVAPAPVRKVIYKIDLRRKLRAFGKETAFDALLDANPQWRRDYDDANSLWSDDPLFTVAAPFVKQALALTDEQFATLLS